MMIVYVNLLARLGGALAIRYLRQGRQVREIAMEDIVAV